MLKSLLLLGAQNAKMAVGRQASVMKYFVIAAIIGLFATAFTLFAVFAWLAQFLSPPAAALIIALFLFVLAAIAAATGNYNRKIKAQNNALVTGALVAAPTVVSTFLRRPKVTGIALLAVTIAAIIAGRRMNQD